MNYNHLFYFYTVARLGGVSRAATFLRVSQPSLSVQIKNFESYVGEKLFQKIGRGIQLTAQGERVYRYCQKIFEAVGNFENYLKGLHEDRFRIRVGVTHQIESPFVADLFSKVFHHHEKVSSTFFLVSGTQSELVEQLKNRKLDLVLSNTPLFSAEFVQRVVVNMPVGLFISTPLYKKKKDPRLKKISVKNLIQSHRFNLILPSSQQRLRHETDLFLQNFSFQSDIALESDILSVVARGVVDSVGMGFLPYPYVAEELKHKLIVPIATTEEYWSHRLFVTAREGDLNHPLLEEFIQVIERLKWTTGPYKSVSG